MRQLCLRKLIWFCLVAWTGNATFEFGSSHSGFVVKSGVLNFGSQSLTEGSLVVDGGTLSCSSTVCDNILIQDKARRKEALIDGVYSSGAGIALSAGGFLDVQGGSVIESITVAGTEIAPSIIQGYGSITSDLLVDDQSQLTLNWHSPLFVTIDLGPTTAGHRAVVKLNGDLFFGPYSFFSHTGDGYGHILFNGSRLFFGGDAYADTVIDSSLSFDMASCFLTGPVTLSDGVVLTMTDSGYWNGSGSRVTFGAGASINNGGNAMRLENIVLSAVVGTELGGAGLWTFSGAELWLNDKKIRIDGSLLGGEPNIFGGSATFGPGVVTLESNVALQGVWTFGSSDEAAGEAMHLNLNGFTIDLAALGAGLFLQGTGGSSLRISNGCLVNVSGTKLAGLENTKIILEDVEVCLSLASGGNYTFAHAALDIEGRCGISGVEGNVFNNTSTALMTIKPNAVFSVLDGIVYSHNNSGTANFVLAHATSCLELIGGFFRHPASVSAGPLMITTGKIVVDHKSYIQPGADGICLGDGVDPLNNVSIKVRPGATIEVGSDGASSGTLFLAEA